MKRLKLRIDLKGAGKFIVVALVAIASLTARAQLVADGETNVLDGVVVNGLQDVTIGTNASFTTLVLTNAAAVTNSGHIFLGYNNTSQSNRLSLAGGGTVWNCAFAMHVGWAGACNELVIFDGALMTNYDGYLINRSNLAVISGPGSTWFVNAFLIISGAGNRLVVTNGGRLLDTYAQIGIDVSASNSLATVVGTNSLWSTGKYLYVGNQSSFNQLDVLDGAFAGAADAYIGYDSLGSNNTVRVSSASWTNGTTHVGYFGSANRLIITNGGRVVNNVGYVGQLTSSSNSSGNNTVIVTGTGSIWQCGSLFLGPNSKGNQLVVSNGGTVTASSLLIGSTTANASNQLIVVGGNVVVANPINVNYGTLTLNSGLLSAALLTLSGSGQPEVAFNGGTMQIRSTAATATPFTVGDGTNAAIFEMLLNGTHSFPGGLILRSNATLKGIGMITGNVTNQNGGTLSPGSSIGQISMNADLVFLPGSTNVMDLNANTGASDTIVGMMNVTYRGTLLLNNLAGSLADGNSLTLFSATNYFGAFDSVLPHSPGPGLRWNLDRMTVDGVLQVVAKTPSPPPLISGTTLSAGNLVITGGNGVPYDPCVMWSSTNLVASVWTPWVTNYFDASGNAIFNNPILPDEPARFFRLQVE